MKGGSPAQTSIRLSPYGVELGGRAVPLLAGSVHYYHLARRYWRPALEELKSLGARLVDTYVPWGVHEKSAGKYDFGKPMRVSM